MTVFTICAAAVRLSLFRWGPPESQVKAKLYSTSQIPIMSNFLARVCIRESFLKVFASIESLSYRDHVESLKQEL